MDSHAPEQRRLGDALRPYLQKEPIGALLLGLSSGAPFAMIASTLTTRLAESGIDKKTVTAFALIFLFYNFKFLWAPLMDRFEPPLLGRRRGWLVSTQLLLAAVLAWMAGLAPAQQPALFALAALATAFLSASQDVVVDAYRTDVLAARERGLGGSLSVFGYRLAMILSGGVAFIWAEQWGSWPKVYAAVAAYLAALILLFHLFTRVWNQ